MEQFEEIQIPVMEEKPKKNRNWLVIAAIVAGCAAILAVIVVFIVKVMNIESTLVKGVRNLTQEMSERRQLWEDATGNTLMNELNKVKTTMSFNVSGDELPVTIGIDSTVLRDGDRREVRGQFDCSVMNTDLFGMELYGGDDKIMLSVPDFLERNLEFDAEGIDTQYNNSLLAEKFGTMESEGISLDLFPEESHFMWTELFLDWQEAAENKDPSKELPEIIIEELEEKAEISIAEKDDKKYQCSQYRITVPQERLEGVFEDGMAAESGTEMDTAIELSQDMKFLISIDENDRIVQISLEDPLILSMKAQGYEIPVELTGKVSFAGEGRAIDDILVDVETEVSLKAVKTDESVLIPFRSDYYDDDETLGMHMGMEIVYEESDASVIANLDELTFSVDDMDYKVTGKMTTEPLREEIKPLAGETIRIFEITEKEYEELEGELRRKLLYWLMAFGSLEEW